jgi:hypothetical protein
MWRGWSVFKIGAFVAIAIPEAHAADTSNSPAQTEAVTVKGEATGSPCKIFERGHWQFCPKARAFLQMPERAGGIMPRLLSQTGAFADTRSFTPNATLIPYDIIVPFWSDGATKTRWVSVPDGQRKNSRQPVTGFFRAGPFS